MAEQLNAGEEQRPFAVGEEAIVTDATQFVAPMWSNWVGQRVVVIGLSDYVSFGLKMDYTVRLVRFDAGSLVRELDCRHGHLRRPRPPQRDDLQLTTWDKCLWKPEGVRA